MKKTEEISFTVLKTEKGKWGILVDGCGSEKNADLLRIIFVNTVEMVLEGLKEEEENAKRVDKHNSKKESKKSPCTNSKNLPAPWQCKPARRKTG